MKHIAALILASFCTLGSQAQIGEWIADQIKSEIQNQVSHITNYNSNTLGSFGNYLWESVVSAKCQSDLEDKAKEFKSFPIDRSYLDGLDGKYAGAISWKTYDEVGAKMLTHSNSFFHQAKNIRICDIAGSIVDGYAASFIDSCVRVMTISSVESVFSKQVLDSINQFTDKTGLCDSLLADVNKKYELAIFLNHNPQALRVYCNTLGVPELRRRPAHLHYWAVKAGSYRKRLPKKNKLPNPLSLLFVQNGMKVNILNGDDVLGEINGSEISVSDINLMNFPGRPNSTYIYLNNRWETDREGRVVVATQTCSKELNKKCKKKNFLEIKEIKAQLYDAKTTEQGFFNSPEYGAPKVLLNAYVYEKTKSNQNAAKDVKKDVKASLKKNQYCVVFTRVIYNDNGTKPAGIDANGHVIVNSVGTLMPKPTQPESYSVNNRIKTHTTSVTPKTSIIK